MNPLEHLRPGIRSLKPYTIEHTTARIKLDANESPYEPPDSIRRMVIERLHDIHPNRYPDPSSRKLKKAIAPFLGVSPEQVLLGNGSDELIGYLITTFAGSGRGVLFPTPTFAMYGILATSLGEKSIQIPLDQDFQIEPEDFLRVVREESPEIIFLASPNNPTGNEFPEELVIRIIEESGSIVVLDEAYIDFSAHPGYLRFLNRYPNLVVLRTLSKIGMAALRLGILVANPEVLQEVEKVRLPYNINALSQTAATIMLEHRDILQDQIRAIVSERDRLFNAMTSIPQLQLVPSRANFILFRTDVSDTLFNELLTAGILVRNFHGPGTLKNCLRVTVGRPEENDEFLNHLHSFFMGGQR